MRTLAVLLLAAFSGAAADPSYYRDVRPILQRQCQGCHQPNLKSSGLDLSTYDGFAAGGKRGPAAKTIVGFLTGGSKPQMPLGQPPLATADIDLVKAWIAAGARDDTPAEAHDTTTATIYAQPPVITALAFSPDGKHIAVSGSREILIHSVDDPNVAPQRLPGLSDRILSLAFSNDGTLLLAGGGTPARFGELQFWDIDLRPRSTTAKLRRSVMLTGDTLFGASLSPDGKLAAAGCTDNTVRIVDVATGKELYKMGAHENWILGTVFGGDSKRIVSVGRDRAAKLTDATSGAFLENINLLRDELAAVARHPAKEIVVIGGQDRIPYLYLMDRPKNMKIADDTTLIRKLDRQNGIISALALSPDGKHIAVGGAAPEVNIYDAETGKSVASCKGHTAGIYTLAFSPDSTTIAAAGFDGTVRLYDAATGQLKRAFVPVPLAETGGSR